jgi:hypothetical protein
MAEPHQCFKPSPLYAAVKKVETFPWIHGARDEGSCCSRTPLQTQRRGAFFALHASFFCAQVRTQESQVRDASLRRRGSFGMALWDQKPNYGDISGGVRKFTCISRFRVSLILIYSVPLSLSSSLGAGSGKQTQKPPGAHQERILIAMKENTAVFVLQTKL